MNDSKKAQDIFKARVIATGMSIFFIIMGCLTIYSRHYSIPVDLHSVKQVMLAQIDLYMGFAQISLGLLPLTLWFNNNKSRFNFMLLIIGLAIVFFFIMYSKMV